VTKPKLPNIAVMLVVRTGRNKKFIIQNNKF
jgi:hypothetical protein